MSHNHWPTKAKVILYIYNHGDIQVEFHYIEFAKILFSLGREDFETDITGNRAMEHFNYGHWNESYLVFFLWLRSTNLMFLVFDSLSF